MTEVPEQDSYSEAVIAIAENFRAAKAEVLKAKVASELLQDTVWPGQDEESVASDAKGIGEAAIGIADELDEIIDLIVNDTDPEDDDEDEDED